MTPDYIRAHRHSIRHREEIRSSDQCGCFSCCTVFTPFEIKEWTGYEHQSIPGTRCGIDGVLGSEYGSPLTRPFLRQLELHWFSVAGVHRPLTVWFLPFSSSPFTKNRTIAMLP